MTLDHATEPPTSGVQGRNAERTLPGTGEKTLSVQFAGLALILDSAGVIFVPSEQTLIVSDLHLEKGSGAASRGRLIPAYDSHDTLGRLGQAITRWSPLRVICLGDSFHDKGAGARMAEADRQALAALCAAAREWIWISGNHDPETPVFCEGRRADVFSLGDALLRHQPDPGSEVPQICGHYHPKTSISAGGYRFSGRCFSLSTHLLIMPAFGAYTGGLSCIAPAIATLHRSTPKIFMIHAAKIWRVA